jgi:hypothetical protein
MNKLLDELSQKAEDYADDTDLPWLATYTEKLAELIVKECARVCLDQPDPQNLNYKPSEKFAEAVKQRFGVK